MKDRLKDGALGLSGGQQQRLCIARALAVEPDVILMDEPASALDPIATTRIEDLMHELKRDYTIVIVTHNMQQAARVADMTAFFSVDVRRRRKRAARHPRRVRHDDEDLHDAVRQAHGGLRDGEVRLAMRAASDVPGGAPTSSRSCSSRVGSSSSARCGPPSRRSSPGRRARRRGDRLRRRHRRACTCGRRRRSSSCSRGRRRSRATFASCSRFSTRTSTSSGWATSARRSRS